MGSGRVKLLLDTHAFIWWDSEPARMSAKALARCQDRGNKVLLSVASVWEMQIKAHLGKLTLSTALAALLESQRQTNGIIILPIISEHVLALDGLPAYHKDPFDRLLVAQAKIEGATLVSHDPVFANYPVNVLW